jgi:hypothetical protein
MLKKISLLLCLCFVFSGMVFAQDDGGASDKFMKIQADIGYGGWLLGAMVDTGGTGIVPGGLTFAGQVYFGDVNGIMGGVEIAYLPLIYGKFDTGSSTFETSVVFIAASANVQLNYGFGFTELGIGYGFFVGSIDSTSGSESMNAEGPVFVKIGTGLKFNITDAMAISIALHDYIPITSPLAGSAVSDVPGLLFMMWAARLGVSYSF